MTDEHRASSVALVLLGERFLSEQAVALLREEFAAVRAEERRAIVAYIRANYAAAALAGHVERGDHEES